MLFDDFHGQFLLSPTADASVPGWPSWECGQWRVSAHPGLPVNRIISGDGAHIGFALGHMIDESASLLQGDLKWPLSADPALADSDIRSCLYHIDGRYVVAILRPGSGRIYLDAAGTLAAVFCRRRHRVASTPGLLVFDEQPNPVFARDPTAFPADRADQFFPAGLTCDPEITRLLPNHHLDLDHWIVSRHFPDRPIDPFPETDMADCIRRIHRAIRRQIEAAVKSHGRTYLTLTAGRDSRILLACARDFMDRIECVTFHGDTLMDAKRIDREIPALLASRLGFRHTILETRGPMPPEATLAYHRRTGFVLNPAKARNFDLACRQNLDMSATWLSGHGGEVGRAVYWTKKPPPVGPLEPQVLLGRLALGRCKEFLGPLADWLAEVPPGNSILHLTLGYIEHRLGAWASAHLYGGAPFAMKLLPLCGHELFDIMLRLPPTYQRRNAMTDDLIRFAWPELLCVPFNADPIPHPPEPQPHP